MATRTAILCIAVIGLVTSPIAQAEAPPRFRFDYYGLTDSEHVGEQGSFSSYPYFNGDDSNALLPSGAVIGYSMHRPLPNYSGQSAWIAQADRLTRLGITDRQLAADETEITVITAHAAGDRIVGNSYRAIADSDWTGVGWLYDGTKLHRLGLYEDPSLTRGPLNADYPVAVNAAGQVVGQWVENVRWHDNQQTLAWFFDGAKTTRIGLAPPVDALLPSHNRVDKMNASGQVIGAWTAQIASEYLAKAWIYDRGVTTRIGLIDGHHHGSTIEQSSIPLAITNSGLVTGHSMQYPPDEYPTLPGLMSPYGQSAWIYRDGVTRQIGLLGPEFVDEQGFSNSAIQGATESGLVAGISRLTDRRSTAPWIDDGNGTAPIPLPSIDDADESGVDILHLSEDGHVFMRWGARRLDDTRVTGAAAYYNGQTRRIGLKTDAFVLLMAAHQTTFSRSWPTSMRSAMQLEIRMTEQPAPRFGSTTASGPSRSICPCPMSTPHSSALAASPDRMLWDKSWVIPTSS
jgi:hypothetical protein